jgi:hypothetical protein
MFDRTNSFTRGHFITSFSKSILFQSTSTKLTLQGARSTTRVNECTSPGLAGAFKSYARSMNVVFPTPAAPTTAMFISRAVGICRIPCQHSLLPAPKRNSGRLGRRTLFSRCSACRFATPKFHEDIPNPCEDDGGGSSGKASDEDEGWLFGLGR